MVPGTEIDDVLLEAFRSSASSDNLDDIYQIYFWNYCSGSADGSDLSCTGRKAKFWFNPVEVWGLEDTKIQEHFPDQLQDGLNAYRKVAGWMYTCYWIAICVTAAEMLVGWLGLFSRWGSFVTTLVSGVSTLATVAGASTSTALYGTIVGALNTSLEPYNMNATVGRRMLSTTWLAAAFSIGAGLFWVISTCCCSGKSSDKKGGRKGTSVEKGPYTYERVGGFFGAKNNTREAHHDDNVPLRPMGGQHSGYEPYRHQSHV